METRRFIVRAGVRPRKFVDGDDEDDEEVEEDLRSELYIGRDSELGGSSSTGDGSSSCIGKDDTEPREVVESRGGRLDLDDIVLRSLIVRLRWLGALSGQAARVSKWS